MPAPCLPYLQWNYSTEYSNHWGIKIFYSLALGLWPTPKEDRRDDIMNGDLTIRPKLFI